MRWAEGPVYFPDGGYLLFSDIPNNRIMKFDEKDNSLTVFRSPANYANGNARDRQGRLVTCEHSDTRRITRTENNGDDHGAGRQFRRQAPQRAQRHRREVRRHHLVHRSAVRHQRRMGRQPRPARAGNHQRLSGHPGQARSTRSSPTSSIRTAWHSRPTRRSSTWSSGGAPRTAASGATTSPTTAPSQQDQADRRRRPGRARRLPRRPRRQSLVRLGQ